MGKSSDILAGTRLDVRVRHVTSHANPGPYYVIKYIGSWPLVYENFDITQDSFLYSRSPVSGPIVDATSMADHWSIFVNIDQLSKSCFSESIDTDDQLR